MKKLSVFSFEGLLLRRPQDVANLNDWMSRDDCLFYPYVPDLPGKDAWDKFATSFLSSAQKQGKNEVIIFSFSGQEKTNSKRVKFLLSTLKIENYELVSLPLKKDRGKDIKRELGLYLTKSNHKTRKYEEVELYFRDIELAKSVADYVINNFSLTTRIHDLYSS